MRSYFLPRLAPIILAVLSLGLLGRPAFAAVLGVPSQYATIQAAVNAAQNGDTVVIADGTYTGPGNVDIDFSGKNITVTSQHGAASTIINCGGSASAFHRGFYLHSGETSAVISGLTVQNGYEDLYGTTYGGGINAVGASLSVQGCVLKGNEASYGGGVSNSGTGSLQITNCVFLSNIASEGGGLSNNVASGGAIPTNNPGAVTLLNCTFTGNQVYGDGGAVYSYTSNGTPITLTNCIFYGDIIFANSSGGAKTSEVLTYSGATVGNCDVQGGYAGTNNINSNPLFFSASDLHLQAGSPCLGAGTISGAPAMTIDGRTRPTPPSIGAYEAVTAVPSTVTLTSSLNPANVGQSVTFTATIAGASSPPTGSVTFSIDGAAQAPSAVSSRTAAISTVFSAGGSHTITAAYSGDGSYIASSAPSLVEVVNPHINPQYVSPSGSDNNPGTPTAPKLTIQAAISAALAGDTVIVEDGTYTGYGNVDLDTAGKNLTVTSQNGAAKTVIDCGGTTTVSHRGFYLHSGETAVVISGFTIQNGNEGGSYPGSPNYPGGGILSYGGLTVQGCILKNNTAGVGGGLYSSLERGAAQVLNCVFIGNAAGIGGGLDLVGGSTSVTNCTITGNTATGTGTIPPGGGIATLIYGYPPNSGGITLTNDIVYGDKGGEVVNQASGGPSPNQPDPTAAYCDIQGGFAGTGNINADPLFVFPPFMGALPDLHLQYNSPCAGMGTATGAPVTAVDGQMRPTPPSIGAYEVALPSFLLNDTDSGITYNGGWFYNSGRGLGDLRDDVHATVNNGASLSYSFLGTGVSYLSETYSDEGMVAVYIDGVFKQTVNCATPARQIQQSVYSISGLAPGLHSIKLVKISGTVMVVDGLRITTTPAALPVNIINDTSSALQYNGPNGAGSWFYSPNRNFGDVGDDVHAAVANGSGVIYNFNGTAVSYVTETNTDEGSVDVVLDNVLQTTVSCVTATRKTGQTVWSKSGLTPGPHTLLLIKRDGQYMLLDALLVTPSPTVINDTDPSLSYSGAGWFYNYGRGLGDLGDDVHATVYNGDALSYSFTGTSVSYLTETNPDEGNVAVYVDGILNQTVSCVTPTRQVQQTVFSVSGLTPGAHTLTLVKASGVVMVLDGLSFQ